MSEHLKLTVDSATVFDSVTSATDVASENAANPSIIPIDIRVAYNEPRKLTIQTLADMGESPLRLYQSAVDLWVDDVLRFSGKPYTKREGLVPGRRTLMWDCFDGVEEAKTLRVIDPNTGWPIFAYVADWLAAQRDPDDPDNIKNACDAANNALPLD